MTFQCLLLLPFHTVHRVLKARILKRFAIPFSSGPHSVRTLHHDPSVLVAIYGMAHSFIELDKAVVHLIRLVSFLWCGFCLSGFWCHLSANHLTGFLWHWTWGISSWTLLLTLDIGIPSLPPLLNLDLGYLLSEAHSSSAMQLLHHIYSIKEKIVWSSQLMQKIHLIILFVVGSLNVHIFNSWKIWIWRLKL